MMCVQGEGTKKEGSLKNIEVSTGLKAAHLGNNTLYCFLLSFTHKH